MTDAPERIWLDWPAANKGDVVYDEPPERDTQPGQTEYVRADLVNILRADRDSAARMWQASEQEREAAVGRAREASQYLAIETQHAEQAEAFHTAALDLLAKRDAELARVREALVDQNDLLRSAMQIAKREGVEGETGSTNWDAYYNRVVVVLKRHRATVNTARAALTPEPEGDAG